MKQGESKEVAFKRIATRRANSIIKDLQLIGNLANTNNYSYSENEIRTIFSRLEEELKLAKMRFSLALNKKREIQL